MNVRYFHEFKGRGNISYRFEILSPDAGTSKEVTGTSAPFVLKYEPVKKLSPVRGAQATLELISERAFQFTDLHTDDMQGYQVRFYRDRQIYWIGWLDSELYTERLSAYPPYDVQFSAADFNIWERLKYQDMEDVKYADIVPLIAHLKRCFAKLNLPFKKLYIGCTTIPEGITMSDAETPLHVLYMMSQNFYDEDNEPMTCRAVVESILQPFGLMMVQKDSNVYIYDYNTVKQGLPMKRYDFDTFSYETDEAVNFNHGNLLEIGFMSTEGDYGFEEMVNNVAITSSLYGDVNVINASVSESNLQNKNGELENDSYTTSLYSNCEGWDFGVFMLMKSKETNNTLMGAKLEYTGAGTENNKMQFKNPAALLVPADTAFMRLKVNAYINTKKNPFDNDEIVTEPDTARRMVMYCRVLLSDDNKDIMYYNGVRWKDTQEGKPVEETLLVFMDNGNWRDTRVLDKWLTNSTVYWTGSSAPETVIDKEKDHQAGLKIQLPPKSGYVKLVIDRAEINSNETIPKIFKSVKDLLIDKVSLIFEDVDGNSLSTDDFEFKSYVNKKVKADFDDVILKCISANEAHEPIGKANILRREGNSYQYQTSFTRAGQTDILERLLMCTIHSNYSQKNEQFSSVIKITDNPALSYVTCNPILRGQYLVAGCTLDFNAGKTTISAVGYSDDTAKLSNIPYD